MVGLEGIRQGIGLDIIPFYVATSSNDQDKNEEHLLGEPGVDAFYKITPNLTLSVTANTDFAETEVDARQINLTRFPLFFPERRDFFLQDSGVFAFSELGSSVVPFFSRTIGLDGSGMEVPLIGGAKLTGRVGDYNLGVLDIETDDSHGLDGENLFVARVSKNVGEQSSVGGILTHGNPSGPTDNNVFGLDATFRTSDFLEGKRLVAGIWGVASDAEKVHRNEAAYGAFVRSPNDELRWSTSLMEIQKNFDPALGFVRRKGIRQYSGGVGYMPRVNETIRQFEFSVDASAVTNTHDVLETWEAEVQPLGINFESGDSARVELIHTVDRLMQPFEISKGVTIPAGEYDYDRWRLEFDSSEIRPLSVRAAIAGGEFYSGDRRDLWTRVSYRTGPLFSGSLEWVQNDVDLRGGEFTTQLSRLRAKFSFSPDVSWNTFVQWDNVSEIFGINTSLRWIPVPGREVFLVFNQSLNEAGRGLTTTFQELAAKVSYTIRL